MTGGLMMSGARLALLAASGLFVMGAATAQAADLGGDCCGDLEERIAELEATTVRKGNRKVSLTISGQVTKAVMFWDDGNESNTYVVDNDAAQTRFRFLGKAKINDDWSAGYLLEIGLDTASSDAVNQFDTFGEESSGENGFELRQSSWYIQSKSLGQATVGHGSMSTDDLYKHGNVGTAFSDAELHYNGKFFINRSGDEYSELQWDDLANNLDTSRVGRVRYDSPTIAGFVLTAAWGADDMWDMALRYSGEFEGVKIAAAIGYVEDRRGVDGTFRDEPKDFMGSIGIHETKVTGLYFYGAAGQREFDQRPGSATVSYEDTADYYYGQIGVNKKFIPLGATIIHADYGIYNDWGSGGGFDSSTTLAQLAAATGFSVSDDSRVVTSEVTRYGFGVTQKIDAAAMELYAIYNHYEADVTYATSGNVFVGKLPTDDWWGVVTGARIQF